MAFARVTISINPELLKKIDERINQLKINRSEYLRILVLKELGELK